jgi:hypothetical protein
MPSGHTSSTGPSSFFFFFGGIALVPGAVPNFNEQIVWEASNSAFCNVNYGG